MATFPEPATQELNRERLLTLDRGQPILVAEAPSGFGKTSFARSWVCNAPQGTRCFWVSLDDSVRDPAVFLDRLAESVAGRCLKRHEAMLDDEAGFAERFAQLAEQLAGAQQPLRLVFDDAHHLAGSTSRTYLQRLLQGASPALRILVTMQPVALDVGLGALTGKSKVCWINAGSLALTRDEIEAFAKLRGHELTGQQLDWLIRTTQGWPALVQLALAVPLGRGPLVPGNVAGLGPIREYIYERFLTRLELPDRDMLWTLACVGTAPLKLLRSLSAAPAQLETMLPRLVSLGIVQQQEEPLHEPSIRLHPLVCEAVLRVLAPDRIHGKTQLVLAAAQWYRRHGYGTAAVRLLLEAGSEHSQTACEWLFELARELIFHRAQHQTLIELVEQWEYVAERSDPRLDRMTAWALIFQRRFAAAQERIRRSLLESRAASDSNEEQLQQAVIAAFRDDYGEAGRLAQAWLARDTQESFLYTGTAWCVYAFHLKCISDIAGAQSALREAHKTFVKAQSGYGTSWAYIVGALALVKIGRHRDALAEVDRGLLCCDEASGLGGQRAMLRALEAFIRYERNELSNVRNILTDALTLLPDQGLVDTIVFGFTAAARLRVADGDLGAALDILSEGERCGEQREFRRLSVSLRAERALVLARSGASGQARRVAEGSDIVFGQSSDGLIQDRAGRLNARVYLADGDSERAHQILLPLVAHARAAQQNYKLCELLILLGLAEDLRNNHAAAFEALREALELARIENYLRVFLDEGPDLLGLLHRWLKAAGAEPHNRSATAWAEAVVAASDTSSSLTPADSVGGALFQELNKRERQLLTLLDQGLSNSEIAARCFLVEGTIKWHLHNLYGKLGVRSRTAALRAARAHGILA